MASDSGKRTFHCSCSCGCGDGFEMVEAFGSLYVNWFRNDWYGAQRPGRSGLADRLKYLRGNDSLRGIICDDEALRAMRDFLSEVRLDPEGSGDARPDSSMSFTTYFIGGERIHEIGLEGRLRRRDVLRGRYYRMFALEPEPAEIRDWIASLDAMIGCA